MSSQLAASLVRELKMSKEFFDRSTRALDESDSHFSPEEDMMTVARQVAHVAHTVEWFVDGATKPEGFDLDFAKHATDIAGVKSLKAAREWFDRAHKRVLDTIGGMDDSQLQSPLPAGPVMGGAPRMAIVGAIADHNAHHRGCLAVYTRLLGKVPPMPYMEM